MEATLARPHGDVPETSRTLVYPQYAVLVAPEDLSRFGALAGEPPLHSLLVHLHAKFAVSRSRVGARRAGG